MHGPEFAEARRSRTFWTLCAVQFLFLPSVASVPLHIAAHGADLGMTVAAGAALLTVMGAASIVGRLSVGAAIDRIGGRNTYVLCFVPLLISLVALVAVDTHGPLFAVVATYGFAHGGFFTVVSPAVAEFFGTRAHGAIFGGVLFFGTMGAVVGPIMAGWTFDATRQLRVRLHGPCRDGRPRPSAHDVAAGFAARASRAAGREGGRSARWMNR